MEKHGQWKQTWNMLIQHTLKKDWELILIQPIFPKPVGKLLFDNDLV